MEKMKFVLRKTYMFNDDRFSDDFGAELPKEDENQTIVNHDFIRRIIKNSSILKLLESASNITDLTFKVINVKYTQDYQIENEVSNITLKVLSFLIKADISYENEKLTTEIQVCFDKPQIEQEGFVDIIISEDFVEIII